jgi:hypothetical protein
MSEESDGSDIQPEIFTMKSTKSMKKKQDQDVYRRLGRLAAGLLHVLHALHGE